MARQLAPREQPEQTQGRGTRRQRRRKTSSRRRRSSGRPVTREVPGGVRAGRAGRGQGHAVRPNFTKVRLRAPVGGRLAAGGAQRPNVGARGADQRLHPRGQDRPRRDHAPAPQKGHGRLRAAPLPHRRLPAEPRQLPGLERPHGRLRRRPISALSPHLRGRHAGTHPPARRRRRQRRPARPRRRQPRVHPKTLQDLPRLHRAHHRPLQGHRQVPHRRLLPEPRPRLRRHLQALRSCDCLVGPCGSSVAWFSSRHTQLL
mmetsp:Transcript_20056/g.62052  ORF Transcript_20056/g.62052 Transcript_20056/m.62052 type:complete len:259 (-) Transcript_20056:119-895(-)